MLEITALITKWRKEATRGEALALSSLGQGLKLTSSMTTGALMALQQCANELEALTVRANAGAVLAKVDALTPETAQNANRGADVGAKFGAGRNGQSGE